MNVVFIVPTGLGAEIGGHSGDATPAAKLVASACDKLIIHPNVVNASDINEMTDNMLYVEGSILDRFLEGYIGLEEKQGNKILLVVNEIKNEIVNAASAARATIGADIEILELNTPIQMEAFLENNKAGGRLFGIEEAVLEIGNFDFDVVVVNTPIVTNDRQVKEYLTCEGGINIWGGIEAQLSKVMSEQLNKPVIHAPVENSPVFKTFNEIVDPRKAAEIVSVCYLHCCLKGAHVAPKISMSNESLHKDDIDFMVSPTGIYGRPHVACEKAGIPIIFVTENRTVFPLTHLEPVPNPRINRNILARNYLEVIGIINAKKAGVSLASVRRPLLKTKITKRKEQYAETHNKK